MKLRRVVSMTLFLSIILETITSVILYIMPQGRVAFWADWKMWGLSKTQWGDLHINLGLLMLIAGGFHIYLNWTPITAYMKNRAREFRMFTPNFNVALIVALLFTFGTWLRVPPFVWVLDLNEYFVEQGARTYGQPPYGHAEESSLKAFLRNVRLDSERAQANLEAAGIEGIAPEVRIIDLAHANDLTSQQLYEVMIGPEDQQPEGPQPIPVQMPRGTGRKTLAEFCEQFNRDVADVTAVLEAAGLTVDSAQSMKAIAESNGREVIDVVDLIRAGDGH